MTAADVHAGRARLVAAQRGAARGDACCRTLVADGRRPPHRAGTFDRVLVDAPCSGLGVLRRRPDARWHVQPDDVDALVALQRALLTAAAELVRAGGTVVYAVCTLTDAETAAIDEWLAARAPRAGRGRARRASRGSRSGAARGSLPQTAGTDGMFVLGLTTASVGSTAWRASLRRSCPPTSPRWRATSTR